MQTLSKDRKQEFLFLQGGGEMGELTRNYDWSKTSIGSPADWPQSLQTTVSLILNSRFPMFLWWGQELIQFYNDAYRPSLGNNGKHPAALGQRGEECWAEIWTTIKPLIYQVLTGGPSTWSEDQLIPIYRNGRLEDVYWTFGHSAVKDESGNVGGVLVVCQETTDKVLSLQRLEESKQQLEFAIDATELATWDLDPVTDTFTANSRYSEWFGIPAHTKTSNEAAFSMIADEDRERVKEAYTKALDYSSKTKFDIEYKICPPGKPVRILRAKGKVWFNEEKIAYRFNGTLQDVTDQVTNRIKLEESEQRFRSLIKEAPIATSLLVGRELKIEVANQAVLDLWGKGNNVVGKTLKEAIPELQGQHFLQTLDNVFTTGKGFSIKADPAVLIKDGVPHNLFFDFTNKPLFDSKGKVWAILSMGVDVTEQVIARKRIEESEQNLRNVILQAPVAMCILRGDNYVVEIANDRMLEFWGKEGEEVLNKPIFEGLPEAKGQGFEELLNKVYNGGETIRAHSVPASLPRKGGLETVYIDFVYEPFRQEDGNISGVMAVAVDVTDQVIARKKIEESEARFRLMADAMPQFIWTSDPQGNLSYFNQAVLNYSGLSYEALQQDGWLQIVHPDDREENNKIWLNAVETGEDFIFRQRFKDTNGNYRWQLSRAVPQHNEDGEIQLWIGTSTDIHDQKLFEEELNRQVKERTRQLEEKNLQLENINLELEQFSYAASHDMQEPLRKVNTFTTFLLENHSDQLDERGKSYLDRIGASVYRMKTIISDLLNYSHQTKVEQEFVPVNLNKIVTYVETDLEMLMEQKETTVVKDELPIITAVPTQMNQLFFNLFSNALKFTNPGVPVNIKITSEKLLPDELKTKNDLDQDQQYVKIKFTDNGIGFEQQYADQIFNLFKRLHGRKEFEGTGIGLGLCKKIVQNHKGTIWAESELGKGATICIALPLALKQSS